MQDPPSYLPPNTLLEMVFLSGGPAPGINPYAARQLTQNLTPIDAIRGSGITRRTVNGGLVNISPPQMRKYKSDINGNDQAPPPIAGIWPGMVVVVSCVYELSFLTAGGSPERPVVPGSLRTEGDYTYFRPILTMMITDFQGSRPEWEGTNSWRMSLEEV